MQQKADGTYLHVHYTDKHDILFYLFHIRTYVIIICKNIKIII